MLICISGMKGQQLQLILGNLGIPEPESSIMRLPSNQQYIKSMYFILLLRRDLINSIFIIFNINNILYINAILGLNFKVFKDGCHKKYLNINFLSN